MKRIVAYPFLFILYIILDPLIYNLDQVIPAQALRPLLVLILIAFVGLLLLFELFKEWHYAGYLVFLGLAFFFIFGHLNRVLQAWLQNEHAWIQLVLLGFWGVILTALGLKRTWIRLGGAQRLAPFLNFVLAIALLSLPVFGFSQLSNRFSGVVNPSATESATPSETSDSITLDCSAHPDIYYIILDGYGRADVLDQLYGLDNTPFLDYLQRKGFYVASKSNPNYMQTIFSVPSALNFTYLQSEPLGVSGLDYFTQLISENRIMHLLKQCGYRTMAFQTGFYFTNHPDVDVYYSGGSRLNEFESLLLAGTPFDVLANQLGLKPSDQSYPAHRRRVLSDFEKLGQIPKMPGPKFVFAHIISPHPPFVFDGDGRPRQPGWSYSVGDGDDYPGTWADYREGYTGQVQFVNHMLEKTIDAILTESSIPPIIILQGDHGPGGFLNWSSPDQSCLWERTSILNAYFLPGDAGKQLYPTISPVNSFRVILNAYFGTGLDLLPDKTYFTSHRLPRQIIDITDERQSTQNCG
jgi:hypothetical protein